MPKEPMCTVAGATDSVSENFLILLVDDNASNRFTLRTVLARLPDCEFIEAASGEDALRCTVEHPVNLILLDVQMPGMDGYETARHLQMTERTRGIPIIFLTAVFTADEFVKRGYALGALDYLTKPLDDNLLLSRVRLYQGLHERERKLVALVDLLRYNERALLEAKERAEAASQAKSIFLSNMSHELRTPLNAVIGFSHLMATSDSLSDEDKKKVAIINRSGSHLLTLINSVLDLSKIEAGRVELMDEVTDVDSLVRELVDMLSPRAEKAGLSLALTIEGSFPHVRVDPIKLRQVLVNLIGNAIKFTREGGVAVFVNGVRADENRVHLDFAVSDTGIGIAADDQDKIFDPFVQIVTHATSAGTGLGLPISKEYLKLLGSELHLESEPGRGSTFRFSLSLPVAEVPPLGSATCGKVIGLDPADQGRKILIVEDDPDSRALLAMMLRPLGFDLAEAEDGLAALDQVEQFEPALVIMDWRMPRLDGLEATRRIRARRGGVQPKILMFSASVFEEQRQVALDAGVDDFLRKPLQDEFLYAAIERLLGVVFLRAAPREPESGNEPALSTQVEVDELRALTPLQRQAIAAAVTELNADKLQQVLATFPPAQADLGRRIIAMTESFKHKALWQLLAEADHATL